MQMYVINGTQYSEDKLPPGVSVDDAQTLEAWLAEHRVAAPAPTPAGTDDEMAAMIAERDATIATLEQQAAERSAAIEERDAKVDELAAVVAERDEQIAALTAALPAEKPEKPAKAK